MDFERLFKDSWEIFVKEIVQLILFALVGSLLCFTIILIPTVAGGFTRGILKFVRTGQAPQFDELWNFELYGAIVLLIIVGGFLIMVGYIFLVIPGLFLSIIWMYSLYFVVDRKLAFWPAMTASKDVVMAPGQFLQHLIVFLIIGALNSLGSAVSGFGVLVTMPFGLVFMSLVYLEAIGERKVGA